MSIVDEKRDIFTTLSSYTSLLNDSNNKKNVDNYESINNGGDILSFFVDLIRSIVGREGLKNLSGELINNLVGNIEPLLKEKLIKQTIQHNAPDLLPTDFVNSGYIVELKDIDSFGLYRNDPNSTIGSLSYSSDLNCFDRKVYSAISNEGSDITYGNLTIKYDSVVDGLIIKPNSGDNIGNFLGSYCNDLKIIDKKIILASVLNEIYGSVVSEENKTKEQIRNEVKINKNLELLSENEFADENLIINEDVIDSLIDGVVSYNISCGLFTNELPIEDVESIINEIIATNNPITIGNIIDSIPTRGNSDIINNNSETVKDNFLKKIIKALILMIIKSLTITPQIRTLLFLVGKLNNGDGITSNPISDLAKNKVFINCLIKQIKELIYQFIYLYTVKLLMKIIKPITKKIIKERIDNYLTILRGLI